ncbi:MAG TPA: RNA polymerase sigma factor [Steroidobacteraceae bacterium]|jgi:RNA polymerase sigma-70 factor (ECF subfamily)|nr:RNA polymerase sigma factor [Steroidobacteraceae bacterium]
MGMTETDAEFSAPAVDQSDAGRDALFERIAAEYSGPMARLARAHEADPSLQQDLLQEIHLALWRSLTSFGGRCSLRTWVYRVAHNVAATHVLRRRRRFDKHLVDLDDVEIPEGGPEVGTSLDEARMLTRIHELVQRLKPTDREVFVLHLEGLGIGEIAEIAGLSHTNTGTKIHRIKRLLSERLIPGEPK